MIEKTISVDVLIIGGGTAGCYAAFTLAESNPDLHIAVVDKANIIRSGCLAAGVNALNAYIVKGRTPEDYVKYCKTDGADIVREDLLLSMARGLNRVTKKLEDLGLVILKDENGEYVTRGNRNIKINGENIKPLIAQKVAKHKNVSVYNHVNVVAYRTIEEPTKRIAGAYGFSVNEEVLYTFKSNAVICATGGAAGLYRPNNPGSSRHKMWYSPFNTGAGFAMGLAAGAELSTLEMRFIALRCKDTIAPTGTLALGVGARQVNAKGDDYQGPYGNTTAERVYAVVAENMAGRGPCYLETSGISQEAEESLKKAYLNMAPAQTLKWVETGRGPSVENVEVEGSEPYVVGGHTASGYWVDDKRSTTIPGLYAAGDVAGGSPQKYVTGCLVEGEIAAINAATYCKSLRQNNIDAAVELDKEIIGEMKGFLHGSGETLYTVDDLEEAMQKTMDEYAGGISASYRYTTEQLAMANKDIKRIQKLSTSLRTDNMYGLLKIYELRERLLVCRALIAHLQARKETRWQSFAHYLDYPTRNDGEFHKYVNSVMKDGEIEIIYRDLVTKGDVYEHSH